MNVKSMPGPDSLRNVMWGCRRLRAVVFQEGLVAAVRKFAAKIQSVLQGRTACTPFSVQGLNAQYVAWLQQHSSLDMSVASITPAEFHPHIQVIVVIAPEKATAASKLLTSLSQQLYSFWGLFALCPPSCRTIMEKITREYPSLVNRVQVVCSPSEVTAALTPAEYVLLLSVDAEPTQEALFSLVATLTEDRQIDMMYADEDRIDEAGRRMDPYFKPGWSPDLLCATNYIGPLILVKKDLLMSLPGYASMLWAGDLYSIALRLGERAKRIVRVPQVLCHVRTDVVDCAVDSGGDNGRRDHKPESHAAIEATSVVHISNLPMVSVVIPTRDRGSLLQQCIDSIERTSRGLRCEIIIVDNGTTDSASRRYLEHVSHIHQVLDRPGPFNFSALNNYAVPRIAGEYILFLNNDVEAIQQGWLEAMLGYAQRPGVGVVGAKLLYPDGSVQHAGVVLGVAGVAGHAFRHLPVGAASYHGFADMVRNCSAVTAACMLMSKKIFQEVGGFDERLVVEYNDVDLCLRVRERGYRIVYTPDAVLYHHENATRRGTRRPEDEALFRQKWATVLQQGDPYYHPNLTRTREDWSLDI